MVVTLTCFWLSWKVNSVRRQREAIEFVNEMEGMFVYRYEVQPNVLPGVVRPDPKPPGPNWLRNLIGIDYFSDVVAVSFAWCPDMDLTPLQGLPNLETLDLQNCEVTDITPIARLGNLTELSLQYTKVRDVSPLAELTKLRFLDLASSPVSDISPLVNLPNLYCLRLSGTPIRDIRPLEQMTNLTQLDLSVVEVNDVSPLARVRKLGILDLLGTPASEESLEKVLKAHPQLVLTGRP